MTTVAHVTHEAVHKIGGIGSVLEGLITSPKFQQEATRNILIGPLFDSSGPADKRLGATGAVLYSSLDQLDKGQWQPLFGPICQKYGVGIVYGKRLLREEWSGRQAETEVILIDLANMSRAQIDHFKWHLYEQFGIRSDRYEFIWDFEQYVRLALPGYEALCRLAEQGPPGPVVVLAHEFMGIPMALRALLANDPNVATVFHAHETASARRIVEDHPAHDTMFYNVVPAARQRGLYFEDVFGLQSNFFKHDLVRAAHLCDGIFAVGQLVREELQFLGEKFSAREISVVPNGIPAAEISFDEWRRSREMVASYAESLLGWRPDYIFTHVARLVSSKAFWRDMLVLGALEKNLLAAGKSAAFILLSTEGAQRGADDVMRMEREYGWPWTHRVGYPDLTGSEIGLNEALQEFNRRSRAVKAIFVNQFGWERSRCGLSMPESMRFPDLRKATDLEFGQSIYEPYGISQFEPLTYGALCAPSNVCGCVFFALQQNGGAPPPAVIIADYVALPEKNDSVRSLLGLTRAQCDVFEQTVAAKVAENVFTELRRLELERPRRLSEAYDLARRMSWDTVAADYLLPAMRAAIAHAHNRKEHLACRSFSPMAKVKV